MTAAQNEHITNKQKTGLPALSFLFETRVRPCTQVVAAGTVDGITRVLFCAKEATNNGTGAWFLAELLQDEANLTLEATFKSKTPSVVPGFVKSFMLQTIFTIAEP